MQDKLFETVERYKLPLALSFVGTVLIIGGIFTSNLNKPKSQEFPRESIVASQKFISVDVSGAVNTPGVYQLADGSRIEEAIAAAGGFAENANSEYISKYLNLAQKLSDGSKIFIPQQGEAGVSGGTAQAGSVAGVQSKVNINTGSQGELESLPGVGPATASKIVSNRPYQTIDELLGKKAVGKAVFEKIKDLVVVY